MKRTSVLFFCLFAYLSIGCSVIINKTFCIVIIKQGTMIIQSNAGVFDFGDIFIGENSDEFTFTIENPGTRELILIGRPEMIQKTNDVSDSFTINQASMVSPVQPGQSTSFSISFNPISEGLSTATIMIPNDSEVNNLYKFTILGKGITKSEINVKQGTTNIPSNIGSFDFGSFEISNSSKEITFAIENLGSANLKLTNTPIIDKYGTDETMFSLNQSSTISLIKPGYITTFSIIFTPTSEGNKSATILIENNDLDENHYTFSIQGTATVIHAIGWIGGASNGWKTSTAPLYAKDYQSFDLPNDISHDSEGNIYVVELNNNRISKWDSSGNAQGWIGGCTNGWKTSTAPLSGPDFQSFRHPTSVFVDSAGYIYVADTGNNRICKWDSTGNAIGWIGCGKTGWQTSWGYNAGGEYNYFNQPCGVYVDSSGNIYVADSKNNRISKWDSSGHAHGCIGGGSNGWKFTYGFNNGNDYQSFRSPLSVFVDSERNIFVADSFNNRISKWDSSGNAIGWIGNGNNGWKTSSITAMGKDYQSFYFPQGLFVDSTGNIYISDTNNHRISKWDSSGNAQGWFCGSPGWNNIQAPTSGTGYQSFCNPSGIFVDSEGYIYIADGSNHRICKWKK